MIKGSWMWTSWKLRKKPHTYTHSFRPTANGVSMSAECTQEVMRYLKGSRWPRDRALSTHTHIHKHSHWLNGLQEEHDVVWRSDETPPPPPPPYISSPQPISIMLLSSSSSLSHQTIQSLVRSGLSCYVKQVHHACVRSVCLKMADKVCMCACVFRCFPGAAMEGFGCRCACVGEMGDSLLGSSPAWLKSLGEVIACLLISHYPSPLHVSCMSGWEGRALRWKSEIAYGRYASSPAFNCGTSSVYFPGESLRLTPLNKHFLCIGAQLIPLE